MRSWMLLASVAVASAAAGVVLGALATRNTPEHGLTASPYVSQQASPVRGLSAQEVDDYLNGRGAGFARTAELNGYPGPRHALDMRSQLALSEAQADAAQRIFAAMRADAVRLGRAIVERERTLSAAFATRRIGAGALESETRALGLLYGQLRARHLRAHLELTALLTPDQIARYQALRGYGAEHRHEGRGDL